MNRLRIEGKKTLVNGMEVSKRLFYLALEQNDRLRELRERLITRQIERAIARRRSKKGNRPGHDYAYRVPFSSLQLTAKVVPLPTCLFCCDIGKVNATGGDIAPCPAVGCNARIKEYGY
jgi:hypothetical protein